ncbi:PAS domain S-box protein [Thermus amyloliquefaciens]|uniref:PAS domain S-box protein n=1 Tax=Thermus amyloliquefaciens TaxID=1449080 RepID=UPI00056FCD38|nr:PAS domain S-box protein [Thermus amyloliquefaciens]
MANAPWKISLIYVAFSLLWILGSDQLLLKLLPWPEELIRWQTGKGLVFVLLSAGLIYALTARWERDRQRSAQLLEASERRFRALVENSREVTFVLDATGRITYASPNVGQVLGYDPQGYLQEPTSALGFVHPEDRPYAEAVFEDLLRHPGAVREYSFRLLDAQGQVRQARIWGRNLLHDPAVAGIVLHVRDESELEEERAKLQGLLEALPGRVFQARVPEGADPAFLPLWYASPQGEAILGYPPQELGKDPHAFYAKVHPEDREKAQQVRREAVKRPYEPQRVTYRFWHGQRQRWIWMQDTLVYHPYNRLLTGYGVEVTEIMEAEERFRLLFQAHPLPMWVYDRETYRFLEVNEAALAQYGYTREEFLSMTILEISPEQERLLEELPSERPPLSHSGPWTHRLKDGREIQVEIHSHLLDYAGRPAVLVVALDVTQEKAKERALRESEALFRTLAETAPALILMWQGERLTFANEEALRLTGYTREELQSRPIWEFVHPADREMVRERGLARIRGDNPPSRYPFRILTKAGEVRWLDYSAARVEIGGKPAVLGVGLDITEAKERELALEAFARVSLALRQSEDLKEMMEAALDTVLAVMEAPAGSILLYDQETGRLEEAASRGWLKEVPTPPTLAEGGMVARAFQGEVVVSQDLKQDPRVRPGARSLVPEGWSGVVVPLLAGKEPVGALTLAWPHPRTPTPREVERAQLVAETLGNAVHRASLRRKLARRVEHLEALRAIDQAIAGSLALEPTLEIFLNQVMRLPLDAAALFLYEPREKGLRLEGHRGFLSPKALLPKEIRLGQGHVGQAALQGGKVAVDDLTRQPGAHPDFTLKEGLVAERVYPLFAKGKLLGALAVFTRRPWDLSPEDEEFLEALATQGAIALDNARTFQELLKSQRELEAAYDLTLWGWAKAVELRDQETAGHTERVTALTLRLSRALGVPEEDLDDIRRGAILHDVGKLGIPDAILLKPEPLTEEEQAIMKKHPVYAYEWLSGIPFLKKALEIPYGHHERWDGSGYPRGLKGLEIPLSARIFAVVDVYDALTSDRPYRKAWPRDKALAYIEEQGGKQFDPEVVAAFLGLMAGEEHLLS